MKQTQPLRFPSKIADRLVENDLSILVTGGSGWFGRATLAMLDDCLGDRMANRVSVFGSQERVFSLPSGGTLRGQSLRALAEVPARPCILLHYAFLGREKTFELPVDEFVTRNDAISDVVTDQVRRLAPQGVFVPSSGAVYRSDRSIDDNLARNPYGFMKRRDERKFLALSEAGKLRVLVSRVFNLAGPFINKVERYALSSILLDIQNGGPVVLRANNPVLRSYFHIGDLCSLVLALLLSDMDLPAEPFDTAGEIEIEVGDLAKRCCNLLGRSDIEIQRPAMTGGLPDRYVGNGDSLNRLMFAASLTARTLDRQILDTAQYLMGASAATNAL